jgi:hypothetical protein
MSQRNQEQQNPTVNEDRKTESQEINTIPKTERTQTRNY